MAVAGRVAIVPKGDYTPNKAYKRLDCVMYNGLTMYIAKKDVPVGTLPTDENYWMKSISTNSTGGLSKKIVEELPTTGIDESTIYLIRKITPGENDVYNEYMYIDGKWELIGNTAVDLSDYYTQEQIDTKINIIHTELEEKLTSTSDISNTIVKALDTTPSARTLPKAGDKIKTIIAKTIKYFNDLKTIAFTGKASDLQDLDTFLSTSLLATEAGKRALDEAVGKVLNDKIEDILTKQGTADISSIGNGTITGAISTLNSDKVTLDKKIIMSSNRKTLILTYDSAYTAKWEALCIIDNYGAISVYNPNTKKTILVAGNASAGCSINVADNQIRITFNELYSLRWIMIPSASRLIKWEQQ